MLSTGFGSLFVRWVAFGRDGGAGCRAAGGAFGASGAGPDGFSDMGGGAQAGPDVRKPAADSSWGQGPGGVGPFLPGAAQVGGERAGEQQLGVRGHDQADPPVGLPRGADPGRCLPKVSLVELQRAL